MDPKLQALLAQVLRQQAPGSGVMAQPDPMGPLAAQEQPNSDMLELEYLAQQSPEQLQAQFQPFDDQAQSIQRQFEYAKELRNRDRTDGTLGIGRAISGIGGAYLQHKGNKEMEDLLKQKQSNAGDRAGDYSKWAIEQMRKQSPAVFSL